MTTTTTTTTTTTDQSNLFEDVLNDAQGVQDRLLGPSYPYYKNIKTPSQIGMSDTGSLSALGKDITGLVDYVELLVSGKSNASATGNPLGNKFFLRTGGKCTDISGATQDRYIYINNVPSGNIPFISSGMDVNFKDFKGLIPGTMSNLNALNPYAIMGAFLSGAEPDCQQITMETIDVNNIRGSATNYVATVDIKNTDPCWFSDGRNPVTGSQCQETFIGSRFHPQPQTRNTINAINNYIFNTPTTYSSASPKLSDSMITQAYFAGLAGVGIYFLYCLSKK